MQGTVETYATTEQVAARLGLSQERVRVLAREGRLPAVRVGERGHYRFSLAAVEQALRGNTGGRDDAA